MTDERDTDREESVNVEEHWVYVSQLEEVIAYTLKSGGNQVVIHVLPEPYKFSV